MSANVITAFKMLQQEPTPKPMDYATYPEVRLVDMDQSDIISICKLFIQRVSECDMLSDPEFKIVDLNEENKTVTMLFTCKVGFEYYGDREYDENVKWINSHLSEFQDESI